jgi:hypothetical protein
MPPSTFRVRSPRNPGVMALAQYPGASFIGKVLVSQIGLHPARLKMPYYCQKIKSFVRLSEEKGWRVRPRSWRGLVLGRGGKFGLLQTWKIA